MSVWPQRPRFIQLVKAGERSGASFEEIAAALDMAPSTLKGYMEQWTRPPSKKAVNLAAAYFKVPLHELLGPELSDEQIELMNAYSMIRDVLGADKTAGLGEDAVLRYYRLAKSVINATAENK